jgi:hypothetical protein
MLAVLPPNSLDKIKRHGCDEVRNSDASRTFVATSCAVGTTKWKGIMCLTETLRSACYVDATRCPEFVRSLCHGAVTKAVRQGLVFAGQSADMKLRRAATPHAAPS